MSQHTLIPALSALLSRTTYDRFLSHVSLQAVHIEPYHISDHIYTSTTNLNSNPGQLKNLRIRQQRRRDRIRASDAREGEDEFSVVYLSSPLSGREYAEMDVRACIALDVMGLSTGKEIQAFVESLGFA